MINWKIAVTFCVCYSGESSNNIADKVLVRVPGTLLSTLVQGDGKVSGHCVSRGRTGENYLAEKGSFHERDLEAFYKIVPNTLDFF